MKNETKKSLQNTIQALEKERENYQKERTVFARQEEDINYHDMQMVELISQTQLSGTGHEKLQSLLGEQREVQEQMYQAATIYENDEREEQSKIERYYIQQEDKCYDKMQKLAKEECEEN